MKSLFKIIIISLLFLISYSRLIAQVGSLEATLSLKNVSGIVIPYQNGIPLPTFEKQKSRTIIDLSGEWKKQRFSQSTDADENKWWIESGYDPNGNRGAAAKEMEGNSVHQNYRNSAEQYLQDYDCQPFRQWRSVDSGEKQRIQRRDQRFVTLEYILSGRQQVTGYPVVTESIVRVWFSQHRQIGQKSDQSCRKRSGKQNKRGLPL